MGRGLLATLRRCSSAAPPLAILLVLVALLSGLSTGASAAPTANGVICSMGSGSPGSDAPSGSATHLPDCCLTGHVPAATLPPPAPGIALRVATSSETIVIPPASQPHSVSHLAARPRGPPLLA